MNVESDMIAWKLANLPTVLSRLLLITRIIFFFHFFTFEINYNPQLIIILLMEIKNTQLPLIFSLKISNKLDSSLQIAKRRMSQTVDIPIPLTYSLPDVKKAL